MNRENKRRASTFQTMLEHRPMDSPYEMAIDTITDFLHWCDLNSHKADDIIRISGSSSMKTMRARHDMHILHALQQLLR